ncbi:DnaB-like helicase N-terminal domain-containing protein [Streptomyces sp. NPDC001443]
MLRTPAHDKDDDLGSLPSPHPPQPVHYAEQAFLGALLLEPHRLDDVTGIEPASFFAPAHGALFTAIRTLPAPDPVQHAQTTSWLNAVLAAACRQNRGLTASYLHTLIQICPSPSHASAYARIIESGHARRTLRAHAQRLTQTAADLTLPHPVPTTLATADTLAAAVEAIAARFPPRSALLPRTPTPPPVTATDNAEEAAEEERQLLATSTAHPISVEEMRWLTADDFTQPLHAGLWQCLTALTRRRTPVDPVTLLWEAQQRGLLASGTEPADLLDVLAASPGSPQHWGERILRRSLLAIAQHVGQRIEAFADDPAITPHQLVIASRRALADLSTVRTRWHHTTSPAPPTTPPHTRAATPSQAGPPRTTTPYAAHISRWP